MSAFFVKKSDGKQEENTYLNARRIYAERYGGYIVALIWWRRCAFFACGLIFMALLANMHLANKAQTVPYIVEVNKLGEPIFRGVPSPISQTNSLILRSVLESWIRNTRSILADMRGERHYIDFVYSFLARNSAAYNQLSDWYRKRQPFQNGQKETIDVVNETAIPIGDLKTNSWTVNWDEIVTPLDGSHFEKSHWRAIITFRRGKISLSSERSTLNPIGLEITHFSWTQTH